MATLRCPHETEIEFDVKSLFTVIHQDYNIDLYPVKIQARWKTWYGWSLDLIDAGESILRYRQSERYQDARRRAIDDLYYRMNQTFAQLAELVEESYDLTIRSNDVQQPLSRGV